MFHLTGPFDGNALVPFAEHVYLNLFPIERDIIHELYNLGVTAYRQGYSTREWTTEVKRLLIKLGKDKGFLTYPRENNGSFGGEWMFDVVWVDAKPSPDEPDGFDWRYARGLKLACESEWRATESHILEDFLKLTFGLADLRLFIYTNTMVNTKDHGKLHPVDLCKRASPLSRGFRYLAVGFPATGGGQFQVDAWVA